ncbi:MAG: Asp-tRNA(Asn)/Glu-tRNA(Gln) amidotransferase subunit GatB [Patescibacteria group bacterium]|jgi:aspartyl-tRNA(Asn)/glutamyl-tRNA(Gln) amidotransferase subunit B
MAKLVPVIGMEIHAELKTKSKMFCTCVNGYELQEQPNKNICPICMGHPGTLPVINKQAIEWTILVGLALNCKIAKQTKFDRKNYFYPDLPKGYQISQYDQPLTYDGYLRIGKKDIDIVRIHLEEDTGKLIHNSDGTAVDLSRACTPLIELVTGPTIESAQEAKEFCQAYQQILRYLEISEADMEKGQMRCEANISMQEPGKFVTEKGEVKPLLDYKLNPKSELKNINSFRAMERAVEFEIKRQTRAIENGEKLIQETRGWDENTQTTFSQRSKETAADYRYFPEPDLPPLEISDDLVQSLQATMPELPQAKFERFINQYQFDIESARTIVSDKHLASYTEQVSSELICWLESLPEVEGTVEEISAREGKKLSKLISNWLINRLFKYLNEHKVAIQDCKITPENFAEFLSMIYTNKINNNSAQQILEEMFTTGQSPTGIMESKNLGQMGDEGEIESIIDKIIADNQKVVDDYKSGKEAAFKFLVGMAMRETKGKANPGIINDLLNKKLSQ